MKEQLISFETAKLAKNKELCKYFNSGTQYVNAFYSEDGINYEETEFQQEDCIIEDRYYRPTQSLLQKWLRKVYDIDITIHRSFSMNKSYHYCIIPQNDYDKEHQQEVIPNRSYETALEKGLQEALKLI